jgi:hypothetical protein
MNAAPRRLNVSNALRALAMRKLGSFFYKTSLAIGGDWLN